jgi:hypothetical protein
MIEAVDREDLVVPSINRSEIVDHMRQVKQLADFEHHSRPPILLEEILLA